MIEWHGLVLKQFIHHMFLASEQAVGYILLMLPDRSQALLEGKTVCKFRNLLKLGIPEKYAFMTAYSRRGYWFVAGTTSVGRAISNERLTSAGFFDLSLAYESIQSDCIGRAVYRTVRTVR